MSLDVDGRRRDLKERLGLLAMVVAMVLFMLLLFVAGMGRRNCNPAVEPEHREQPCADHALAECVPGTAEEANSTQFRSYVYCACMLDDGTAKGYVARGREAER